MLHNRDILCIGFPAWEGDYLKSTVQLLSVLGRYNRILYVEYPYTLKDILTTVLGRQHAPVRRMLGLLPRYRTLSSGHGNSITVMTLPPVLPINWLPDGPLYRKSLGWNGTLVRPAIQSVMSRLGMNRPILINAMNPFLGLVLRNVFQKSIEIYYSYDEIRAMPWVSRHGGKVEDDYSRLVDGVVVSSTALYETRRLYNSKTVVVHNGVDFEFFSRAATAAPKRRRLLDDPPVIGYLGSIDQRLDLELLEHLIISVPDYHFLFTGRIVDRHVPDRLNPYPNVQFTGAHSGVDLIQSVSRMDIGIIPFKRNRLTRNIYPLKANEYLAAGKPVVMTPFATLDDLEGAVHIATDKDRFLSAIQTELNQDTLEKQRDRIRIAKMHSWEARAKELSRFISHLEVEPST